MKRFQYNDILRPVYLLLLFLVITHPQYAQTDVEADAYPRGHIWHERTDTIYVYPGERTRMFLQGNTSNGIQGFHRWMRLGDRDKTEKWYDEHLVWPRPGTALAFLYDKRTNSYVKKTKSDNPSGQSHLRYAEYIADSDPMTDPDGIIDSLAWDGSAWKDWEWIRDNTETNQEPMAISLHRRYILKNATGRYQQLQKAKQEYDAAQSSSSPSNRLIKAGYFEKYEVHTPLRLTDNHGSKYWQTGVNFRLKEILSNYYVNQQRQTGDSIYAHSAKFVRWRVFDGEENAVDYCRTIVGKSGDSPVFSDVPETGCIIEHEFPALGCTYSAYKTNRPKNDNPGNNGGQVVNAAVFYCMGLKGNANEQSNEKELTRYITADVSDDKKTWYPVALITVHLEPYSDPQTAEELKKVKTFSYFKREQDRLDNDVNYEMIAEINFDDEDEDGNTIPQKGTEYLNYRLTRLNKESSEYAFGDLRAFDAKERLPNSCSLSRSEYAFYKTLNVTGISKYGDYFAAGDPSSNLNFSGRYFVKVYDRLYERQLLSGQSTPDKMGYFLYLDATDEPGRIVSLPVSTELCSDTKLLVTAWVCNMEGVRGTTITGDIGFTFKGITPEGEQVDLYKFYSGSMRHTPAVADNHLSPKRLEWQQICFEFSVPNADYASYRLDLSNNCQHSDGADYAVDEIKVYRSTPNIYVRRKATCDLNSVLLRSNYETLLENLDLKRNDLVWSKLPDSQKQKYALLRLGLEGLDRPGFEGKPGERSDYFKNLYYAFLDDFHAVPPTRAVDDKKHKWLKMDYNGDGYVGQFGRVIVSTREEDHPKSREEADSLSRVLNIRALMEYSDNYQKLLNANILPKEHNKPEYYQGKDSLLLAYDLFHDLGLAPINCAWFMSENDEGSIPSEDGMNPDAGFIFLADIKTIVKARQVVGEGGGEKKPDELVPGKEYYVMLIDGGLTDEDIVDGSKADPHSPCALLAPFQVMDPIRLVINGKAEYDPHGLCMNNPVNVNATLQAVDPDGNIIEFAPTYYCFDWYFSPDDETDGGSDEEVPLYIKRLFEKLQLFRSNLNENLPNGSRKEGNVEDLRTWKPDSPTLQEIQKELIGLVNDGSLQLSVHDPEFILDKKRLTFYSLPFTVDMEELLEEIERETNRAGALLCMQPRKMVLEATETAPEVMLGLPDIGYPVDMVQVPLRIGTDQVRACLNDTKNSLLIPIRSFNLSLAKDAYKLGIPTGEDGNRITLYKWNDNNIEGDLAVAVLTKVNVNKSNGKGENYIQLQFLPDFKPLEGFTYTLKIRLEEQEQDGTPTNSCNGIAYLPLKIIPKYLTWFSDGRSRNWNNDGVWRRSNQAEVYMGKQEDLDANENDGALRDDLQFAFAPMPFSNVTVVSSESSSWLYELKSKSGALLEMKPDEPRIGAATERIEYDMMTSAKTETFDKQPVYKAIAFNGNICNEIFFKPGATLMRQDYLTYTKARLEFEMEKNKKYFMSSPLQGVIAGDMYTKKDGRQIDPSVFLNIEFSTSYDRFNPAFYQKIWDNSVMMYLPDANQKYEAVASNWSMEYNDVSVHYKPGTGFYSSVENFKNDMALVRLPKNDNSYHYYSYGNTTPSLEEYEIPEEIKAVRGKLSFDTGDTGLKAEVTNATNGTFFFVGNPFMTYLDMEKFFAGNRDLASVYWTEYDAFVLNADGTAVSTSGSTGGFLKPMQGFFVQKNVAEGKSLSVTFTPGMMAADNQATQATRSSEGKNFPTLYISTERKGERSAISIIKREGADAAYCVGEDAAVLLDTDEKQHPALYSVAGSQAVAINQTSDISNIPLGIYSDDAEDVTLTFEGIEQFDSPLYLYDALLDESIRLDALNTKVTVPGSTHGRYFLNGGKEGLDAESDIAIYSPVAGEIIVATSASDLLKTIHVYDLSGRLQLSLQSVNEPVKHLYLTGGAYVVRAFTEKGDVKSSKVIVK